jgi:nucleoside-diphosphate-sugar epimerase
LILDRGLDIGRAREELGWSPKTDLAEGMARMWDWIRVVSEDEVEL